MTTTDNDDRLLPGKFHRPHRLNALADGVFAIAMTLLALEIRVPEDIGSQAAFQEALPGLLGGLGVFALAFFMTGQYWLGQHRVMSYVHTVDATALVRSISALIGVASLPVATSLIIHWGRYPEAVTVTSGLLALTSLLSARFYAHVLRSEFADIDATTRRRFLIQPLFNATVYLLAIPIAYALPSVGVAAGFAAFSWLLLMLTRPVSARIVGAYEHRRAGRPDRS